MLVTKNINYTYDGKNQLRFPDISCKRGEQWLLLGQSGIGKTTLLHILGGLRTPKTGSIFIGETDLYGLSSSEMDRFRGKNIGIVFQQPPFLKALTVEENLAVAQQLAGQAVSKDRIQSLLDRLNLGHKLTSKTTALSQGEQQRLAIARAVINKPVLILADEPTAALDDANCHKVIALLETQAREENATLVIVTHDQRLKEIFPNQITLSTQ
ncbi:MAG: ABC transporter ATP-binding protein [Saprospiraceae bacterium]